jgi:hypothetical protein
VTLLLSQFIVPEQLYPWLTLASGLLVVAVGASVLRQRCAARVGETTTITAMTTITTTTATITATPTTIITTTTR